MSNYLLDTNCFYSISDKVIDLNKVKSEKSNILSCPLSVFEIARCKNEKEDFDKRKRAMRNLINLTTLFIPKTSDYIIDKSFNQKSNEDDFIINCDDIINCLLYSKTYEEAEKGIYFKEKKICLKFEELNEWKKELANNFKKLIEQDDRNIIEILKASIREENNDAKEKEIKKLSKIRYKEIIDTDNVYINMITGLSIRTGLIKEDEYNKAFDMNDTSKIIELISLATENYNYSLESYINVYLEFRKEKILNSPERNDLFDLDFLVYLDVVSDCVFVTNENKWVVIGNNVAKNKFMSKDNFISRFKYD